VGVLAQDSVGVDLPQGVLPVEQWRRWWRHRSLTGPRVWAQGLTSSGQGRWRLLNPTIINRTFQNSLIKYLIMHNKDSYFKY
jgi:hypothetical protein